MYVDFFYKTCLTDNKQDEQSNKKHQRGYN